MKQLFAILVCVCLFAGCKKDENKTAPSNSYAGEWAGTYTGAQDNGTWSATINPDGQTTGTIKSSVFNQTFTATGSVDIDGTLTMTIGSTSAGSMFGGTLKEDNTASGVWVNGSMNGTWTGSKK